MTRLFHVTIRRVLTLAHLEPQSAFAKRTGQVEGSLGRGWIGPLESSKKHVKQATLTHLHTFETKIAVDF